MNAILTFEEINKAHAETRMLREQLGHSLVRLSESVQRTQALELQWSEVQHARRRHDAFEAEAVEAGLPEMFDQLRSEVEETGFPDLYDRWTSGSSLAGSDVTVIPGDSDPQSCTPQVIIFLR